MKKSRRRIYPGYCRDSPFDRSATTSNPGASLLLLLLHANEAVFAKAYKDVTNEWHLKNPITCITSLQLRVAAFSDVCLDFGDDEPALVVSAGERSLHAAKQQHPLRLTRKPERYLGNDDAYEERIDM